MESIESYWAIIIPLAFAVNTPNKAFKRQAQLKVNDISAQERGGERGGDGVAETDDRVGVGANQKSSSKVTMSMSVAVSAVSERVRRGTLRRRIGMFILGVGAGSMVYVSTAVGQQQKECEEEFGACVWERIEPKL